MWVYVYRHRRHINITVFQRISNPFESIKQVRTYTVGSGDVAEGHIGRFEQKNTNDQVGELIHHFDTVAVVQINLANFSL